MILFQLPIIRGLAWKTSTFDSGRCKKCSISLRTMTELFGLLNCEQITTSVICQRFVDWIWYWQPSQDEEQHQQGSGLYQGAYSIQSHCLWFCKLFHQQTTKNSPPSMYHTFTDCEINVLQPQKWTFWNSYLFCLASNHRNLLPAYLAIIESGSWARTIHHQTVQSLNCWISHASSFQECSGHPAS